MTSERRGARVLVIDDEPAIRRAVSTDLGATASAIEEAETGQQALDLLASFGPTCSPRPHAAGHRRHQAHRVNPRALRRADHRALRPRRRARQGHRPRPRRRRLPDQALRRGGAAGAHPRRAASHRAPRAPRASSAPASWRSTSSDAACAPMTGDMVLSPTEYDLLKAFVANPDSVLTHGMLVHGSGARSTARRRTTSTSMWPGCARSSSWTRSARATSAPSPESATASLPTRSRRPDSPLRLSGKSFQEGQGGAESDGIRENVEQTLRRSPHQLGGH